MAITNVVAPNLMANVNQPLPANLRVMPKPIIGGADLNAINSQQDQVYQKAMNFGRMNPDVVLKALGDGGSLSNAFGFSSAVDIAGLTPDQLMALTQGRGADNSLNNAQKTFDAVTGAPEQRAMMLRKGDQQFGVNSQALTQQNNQDFQAQQANAGHSIQLANSQAGLDQQANIANAGYANDASNRAASIASSEKIASAHMDMEQKKLDLESRKLRFMQQSASANSTPGTSADAGMITKFDGMLTQFGVLDPKTRELDFGKADPNHRKQVWQVYMQREAAKGLPYNQVYNVPKTAQADLGGYGQLILGRDGWHGVYVKDGAAAVSTIPIVPYRPSAKGSQDKTTISAPLYGE